MSVISLSVLNGYTLTFSYVPKASTLIATNALFSIRQVLFLFSSCECVRVRLIWYYVKYRAFLQMHVSSSNPTSTDVSRQSRVAAAEAKAKSEAQAVCASPAKKKAMIDNDTLRGEEDTLGDEWTVEKKETLGDDGAVRDEEAVRERHEAVAVETAAAEVCVFVCVLLFFAVQHNNSTKSKHFLSTT